MKKNGKIEALRFLFATIVVVFHINMDLWDLKFMPTKNFSLFYQGALGVEFFYLVSGYLMARTISKKNEAGPSNIDTLGTETAQFIWRKIKALLPYHLIFCGLKILSSLIYQPGETFVFTMRRLPSLFFLSRSGFNPDAFLGVEWYISSMLLAMLLLYPICRHRYNLFAYVIAPLTGILLTGYMMYTSGRIAGSTDWAAFTYKCNLRAVANLCFGVCCYEAVGALQKKEFSNAARVLLSLLETVCYVAVLIIMCLPAKGSSYYYQPLCMIALIVGVTLSFAQTGILAKTKLFQNRICLFLGGASLAVYLAQNIPRSASTWWFSDYSNRTRAVGTLAATLALGILVYILWTRYSSRNRKTA